MTNPSEKRPVAAPSLDFRPGGRGNPHSRASVQKPKNMKKTVGRLLRYLGGSRYLLLLLVLLMLLITAAALFGNSFFKFTYPTPTIIRAKFNSG